MPISDAWQPVGPEVAATASTTATGSTTFGTPTTSAPYMCARICNKSDKWNQVLIGSGTATTTTGIGVPPNTCIIVRIDPTTQTNFSSISIGAPTSGNISVQPGNGGISP